MVRIAKKITNTMGTAAIIMAIAAVICGIAGIATSAINQSEAERMAKEADERQLNNQKSLIDYQIQKQTETNTIATQKGHAADAGFNPALLYGSMSAPGLADISAGSAQGTMPEIINPSQAFSRFSENIAESALQLRQQGLMKQQIESQSELNNSQKILNFARAAEEMRNTKFQKNMERVIYNKGMAELALMDAQKTGLNISNIRSSLMLPYELKEKGLLNEEIQKRMEKIDSEIKNDSVYRAKLRADMKYINAQITRINHENQLTDAQLVETQERFKGSAVQRIMEQYGLANRSIPAFLRKDEIANYYLRQPQLLGAVAQLTSLGFSQDEAVQTVIYYTASNSKDASPSIINAVSRGISALILKK